MTIHVSADDYDITLRKWAWEASEEYAAMGLEFRMNMAYRLFLWVKLGSFSPAEVYKETVH